VASGSGPARLGLASAAHLAGLTCAPAQRQAGRQPTGTGRVKHECAEQLAFLTFCIFFLEYARARIIVSEERGLYYRKPSPANWILHDGYISETTFKKHGFRSETLSFS